MTFYCYYYCYRYRIVINIVMVIVMVIVPATVIVIVIYTAISINVGGYVSTLRDQTKWSTGYSIEFAYHCTSYNLLFCA